MRYDLIITGETHQAQHAAFRAAKSNRLVAVVRTKPFLESTYDYPIEEWNWEPRPTWKSLRRQFRMREHLLADQYASAGIDLFEGRPLELNQQILTVSSRTGRILRLEAEEFQFSPQSEVILPHWLQSEVPHVTPLTQVARLETLPESILIEGNSLCGLRFAVMCARLGRRVMIAGTGWNLPEFEFEMAELEDEADRRGVLRLDQRELLSISEQPNGEFDFLLVNGEVYRTGLYVFATEVVVSSKPEEDAVVTPSAHHRVLREQFQTPVF
ncbi:MAG: hypothetical protein HUJ26_16160 [Planctomycetaceae bacterium]|nr:hypothetical protein [Planctomycetaceae bacterium]